MPKIVDIVTLNLKDELKTHPQNLQTLMEPVNSSLNQATFAVAAHNRSQWLPDTGREVAFVGRSNSGKSSALNTLTGHKRLAITSKTPGRTQQIVFFTITPEMRLVDLPGYGYSKVPEKQRQHWARIIEQYFCSRQSLAGLIHTMDIRHPLKPLDWQLIEWCTKSSISMHILLTKCDKLSKPKINAALSKVKRSLEDLPSVTVQTFSSLKGIGAQEAQTKVCNWLSGDTESFGESNQA